VPTAPKTIPTVLGCWSTHESRVVRQWKIFRHSRNFVMSCVTNDLGRKRLSCYTTAHGSTLRLCMDRIRMKCWNVSTIHPTGWPGLRTAVSSGL
jgi:hypothetical protein